jgi:hypothetical protein
MKLRRSSLVSLPHLLTNQISHHLQSISKVNTLPINQILKTILNALPSLFPFRLPLNPFSPATIALSLLSQLAFLLLFPTSCIPSTPN